ncbi:uncharacterized protein [Dysidea avara]|uniref:uncharacterized protein n=1 Tax=Dysidea avara TaxID=196820 RepID=UPI0033239469
MMNSLFVIIFTTIIVVGTSAPVENNHKITHNKRFIVGHHQLEDVIGQASCAAYMSHDPTGFVYAVRRVCSNNSPTCTDVCNNPQLHAQDPETAKRTTWKCIGATHVYLNRPATGDGTTPTLGLKDYYYGYANCNLKYCGPNYCCCRVI